MGLGYGLGLRVSGLAAPELGMPTVRIVSVVLAVAVEAAAAAAVELLLLLLVAEAQVSTIKVEAERLRGTLRLFLLLCIPSWIEAFAAFTVRSRFR